MPADEIIYRVCNRCKESKLLNTENFYPVKAGGVELIRRCQGCCKAIALEWYHANKERARANNKAWNAAHPASGKERGARRRKVSGDKLRQWHKAAYHDRYKFDVTRKAKGYALQKKRIAAHPEKERERQRNWHHQSGKGIEKIHRRRARIANTPVVEQISRKAIIERDQSTCYLWCKRILSDKEVVLDHVIPLSRNGEHSHASLKVTCRACNTRKSNKLLSELAGLQ